MRKATATSVAQQVSFAIEQEIEYPSNVEYATLTEVGAELENAPNGLQAQFVIKSADGQEWTIRVTPKA